MDCIRMVAALAERLTSVFENQDPDRMASVEAFDGAFDTAAPVDRTDRFLSLLSIYELWTAPLERVGGKARWAGHPAVAAVKSRLEQEWLTELDVAAPGVRAEDPVHAIRGLAAKDRLPRIYRWVAQHATLPELREFLAIEGGPDDGFDDLVAICQVGLAGAPKLELARNYWDEMGEGDPSGVHTDLYHQMAHALELPQLPLGQLPDAALQRTAFCGLLATNRWLQPEMIGALGLTELQAGPRCRLVLRAFDRLCVPDAARPFYEVHADVDPRHGRDWLEQVVAPLSHERPEWRARMIRGALWRWHVNAALFDTLTIGAAEPKAA
jgi:hypothetical protein